MLVVASALLCAAPGDAPAAEQHFITIGTGGVTGVYYPAGGAICSLVNRHRREHGVRCSVQTTGGSIYNLEAIRSGDLDMGIAQSDWQHHFYNGSGKLASRGPFPELRAVFSLHPEPFTVVARADSGIRSFADLKGRRVNVGNPGSGQRGTMEVVMAAYGWTMADFAVASELPSTEQAKALCAGDIDAMVFTVGHPSGSVKAATSTCESVIVDVAGPEIDRLVSDRPYYRHFVIPGGSYAGTRRDVRTFGVSATFVTSVRTPVHVVYEVAKAVLGNFEQFRQLHPALRDLKRAEMARDGQSAPLHEGAIKYYREAGLL